MKTLKNLVLIAIMVLSALAFGNCWNSGDNAPQTAEPGHAPVPGNSGNITASNIQNNSFFIEWTEATDAETAQADLQYKIVCSTSNNIGSAADAEANGIVVKDWTTDLTWTTSPDKTTSYGLTGLNNNTKYYYNVLVKDEAGNKTAYNANSEKTLLNNNLPAPAISVVPGPHNATVTWNEIAGAESYNLYYAKGNTVTTATGTKITGAVSPQVVTGLSGGETYAFIATALDAGGESVSGAVMKCMPEKKWIVKGNECFSNGYPYYISFAIDSGNTPYVAYYDSDGIYKVIMKKYNGSVWETVGSGGISPGQGSYVSLAFDSDDIPYVAYADSNNDSKATVRRFNGGEWETVGNENFTAKAMNISLVIAPDGTRYVLYFDLNSRKVTTMKLSGNEWIAAGDITTAEGFSPSMTVDSNSIPFAAYADNGNSGKAIVKKLDSGNWTAVGTSTGFSASSASGTSIVLDSADTPYVVYTDNANSQKATVKKYNGTDWEIVGSAGFSPGIAFSVFIALDSADTPYVAYYDVINSKKAIIMKYNGGGWETFSIAGFPEKIGGLCLAIDSNDTLYAAYLNADNGNRVTVMSYE